MRRGKSYLLENKSNILKERRTPVNSHVQGVNWRLLTNAWGQWLSVQIKTRLVMLKSIFTLRQFKVL